MKAEVIGLFEKAHKQSDGSWKFVNRVNDTLMLPKQDGVVVLKSLVFAFRIFGAKGKTYEVWLEGPNHLSGKVQESEYSGNDDPVIGVVQFSNMQFKYHGTYKFAIHEVGVGESIVETELEVIKS